MHNLGQNSLHPSIPSRKIDEFFSNGSSGISPGSDIRSSNARQLHISKRSQQLIFRNQTLLIRGQSKRLLFCRPFSKRNLKNTRMLQISPLLSLRSFSSSSQLQNDKYESTSSIWTRLSYIRYISAFSSLPFKNQSTCTTSQSLKPN